MSEYYCSDEEMKKAIHKHSIEYINMLKFYRDNCDKKTRDRIFRSYRKSLMEMISGSHTLMICHEERKEK